MHRLLTSRSTVLAAAVLAASAVAGTGTLAAAGSGNAPWPSADGACAAGYHPHGWVEPRSAAAGQASALDAALAARSDARIVYVGETHARSLHQAAQLEVVCRLARSGDVVVGVEWLQQPFQPYVDDYLAGRIDEQTLRRLSDYDRRWAYPFDLYAPVLRFARDNGIRVLALNVPAELTRKLARRGLPGLSEAEREMLPAGLADAPRDYGRRLRAIHTHVGSHAGLSYERFEIAQLAWDEGMADRVAAAVEADGATTVVVLAGNGHVAWSGGIPDRVERRTGLRGLVVSSNPGDGATTGDRVDHELAWGNRASWRDARRHPTSSY